MILSCQNICKSFGEKIILKDANVHSFIQKIFCNLMKLIFVFFLVNISI